MEVTGVNINPLFDCKISKQLRSDQNLMWLWVFIPPEVLALLQHWLGLAVFLIEKPLAPEIIHCVCIHQGLVHQIIKDEGNQRVSKAKKNIKIRTNEIDGRPLVAHDVWQQGHNHHWRSCWMPYPLLPISCLPLHSHWPKKAETCQKVLVHSSQCLLLHSFIPWFITIFLQLKKKVHGPVFSASLLVSFCHFKQKYQTDKHIIFYNNLSKCWHKKVYQG